MIDASRLFLLLEGLGIDWRWAQSRAGDKAYFYETDPWRARHFN